MDPAVPSQEVRLGYSLVFCTFSDSVWIHREDETSDDHTMRCLQAN